MTEKTILGYDLLELLDRAQIREETALELINAGAELTLRNSYGQSAAELAALHGHVAVLPALAANGADLAGCLKLAAKNGHVGAVRLIAELIAPENRQAELDRALEAAVFNENLLTVETLIVMQAEMSDDAFKQAARDADRREGTARQVFNAVRAPKAARLKTAAALKNHLPLGDNAASSPKLRRRKP